MDSFRELFAAPLRNIFPDNVRSFPTNSSRPSFRLSPTRRPQLTVRRYRSAGRASVWRIEILYFVRPSVTAIDWCEIQRWRHAAAIRPWFYASICISVWVFVVCDLTLLLYVGVSVRMAMSCIFLPRTNNVYAHVGYLCISTKGKSNHINGTQHKGLIYLNLNCAPRDTQFLLFLLTCVCEGFLFCRCCHCILIAAY